MLFPTGAFLVEFLPVTLAIFFLSAILFGQTAATLWVTAASLFFYALWRPSHVVLLAASIVFNYWAGGLILTARQAGQKSRGNSLMAVTVFVDLLALAIFKYSDFLVHSVNTLTGTQIPGLGLALPLGISFFTFTQIAYLADVNAGKAVERSPMRYALFVTYFPHLVAGPVLHHSQMMPQFSDPATYSPRLKNISNGMAFLIIGLTKKVLIADSVAPLANATFSAAGAGVVGSDDAWRGVLAYSLQIYFDFSGYSDMAIGLSLLFNVRLPYNFNSPYKSTNISDFWRRWHMTLSAFLRDYLYIALGGNRHGGARRYFNLLTTMLLGGLWHGASWTFVVWGGLHGIYLVINHAWQWLVNRFHLRPASRVGAGIAKLAGWALTMVAVLVAWVFFRATTFSSAATLLHALLTISPVPGATAGLGGNRSEEWLLLGGLILFVALVPNTQQFVDIHLARYMEGRSDRLNERLRGIALGSMIVVAMLLVAISESRDVTEFIYFNF